ncbi:MAG: CRISPR-associated protein Cas4 [Anaerolineaceae bacterium]|nr:CRISPR-associated protein Cas4 [Anaerolineaceae bacterium]
MYKEEEFLQLSGIQHYCFCPRQWALIHIEQLWVENYLTMDGEVIHENVHDSDFNEKRKDKLLIRGLYVHSQNLGISGQCDLVEFIKDDINGISLNSKKGFWVPIPVEYKRGKTKIIDADRLQLCAQAICLEEMLYCTISKGFLFYNTTKNREEVLFTEQLRHLVYETYQKMHELYKRGYTPKAKETKSCKSCSLINLCLPKTEKYKSVEKYISAELETVKYEKIT